MLLQEKQQIIDGFGAHQGAADRNRTWWKQLYFNDLGCSNYRVDLTPQPTAPYSKLSYYSPWGHGFGHDQRVQSGGPCQRKWPGKQPGAHLVVTLHSNGAVTFVQQPESSAIAFFDYQPNPFSQQTTLRYGLSRPGEAIVISDRNGVLGCMPVYATTGVKKFFTKI